ncbi:MAG: DEAD/DEAH box helicase [Myxococcota bacterium]
MTGELSDFESFSPEIRRAIQDLGWSEPVAVQKRVIPMMREGRDLIVQAVTGSGKTGAFGLPIVEQVDLEKRAIQALILLPTRELAGQVAGAISEMGRHRGVEAVAIYGGVAYGPQLEAFDRGVPIVAGTPGRVLDHLNSGRMDLRALFTLIFDEADELLSLGFWPDMREIQRFVPKRRQSGLFSATIPERVRSLSRVFLHEPKFISMTEGPQSPDEIEHYHYLVSAQEKEHVLLRILEFEDPDSAIVFCNTRDDVRYLSAFLRRHHFDADMIQGDMTQAAREMVMGRIKAAELRFLIATDVAARGIDISDLSHVISYSSPDSPEIYLHRTGRTGRAGKTGTAISLVSGLDIGNFRNLQATNRLPIPERRVPDDDEVMERVARRVLVRLEHELRELPEREREVRQTRYAPVLEKLSRGEEGRNALAALLFGYLRSPPSPEGAPGPTPEATETRSAAGDRPHRRRRRGRREGASRN